jgi:beta-aspartyl-peptidase (threonine type)
MRGRAVVAVHGGAGLFEPERLPECVAGCERAAAAGAASLNNGALAAAVAAVKVLEADPSFNAGLGSTLTRDGTVELDAAVMTGDLRFGGVAACPPVESAIELALRIYEQGEHCLLAGEGAAAFAEQVGVARLDPGALIVERVWRKFEKARAAIDGEASPGTVGAVALDSSGALAAATSTGGILGKRPGRVGDTPLIGAGTYADDEAGGAASATGRGESIMRSMLCRVAVEAIARGEPVAAAASWALSEMERRVGGIAGLILVDHSGDTHPARNTPAMPWASYRPSGENRSGS